MNRTTQPWVLCVTEFPTMSVLGFCSFVEKSLCYFCCDDVEHNNCCHRKKKRNGERSKSEQTSKRSKGRDERGANNQQSGYRQIPPRRTFKERSPASYD